MRNLISLSHVLIQVFEKQILTAHNSLLNRLVIVSPVLYGKIKTYEIELSARIIKEVPF